MNNSVGKKVILTTHNGDKKVKVDLPILFPTLE